MSGYDRWEEMELFRVGSQNSHPPQEAPCREEGWNLGLGTNIDAEFVWGGLPLLPYF